MIMGWDESKSTPLGTHLHIRNSLKIYQERLFQTVELDTIK